MAHCPLAAAVQHLDNFDTAMSSQKSVTALLERIDSGITHIQQQRNARKTKLVQRLSLVLQN
jgi:hypothetical protein